MDTFKGNVIFWKRMAPILKKLEDADENTSTQGKTGKHTRQTKN